MEKAAMEAQLQMTMQMLQTCREKTMRQTHSATTLDSSEEAAMSNCLQKYIQCPQIVMQQMQGANAGAQSGGF